VTLGKAQSRKIKILQADNTYTDPNYPGATISLGNVHVSHQGATLRCDQAFIYQQKNLIEAYGNVLVNQGDTIRQRSRYTSYDADNQLITSWGDVVLTDPVMTLKTDTLFFDRGAQKLYYQQGGSIKDSLNFLKSDIGNYHLKTHFFEALNRVSVTNDDGVLNTDKLNYDTDTGISWMYGPSTITGKDRHMYTERGTHNPQTKISYFLKNSKIAFDNRTIEGDSLYYDQGLEYATATGNIRVIDTLNNSTVKGGYAEVYQLKDSLFITDKAVIISKIDQDSMYVHGQKILVTGKENERLIKVFNRVKFFKEDLQGKCDSLVSNERSGLTELLVAPVIWAQGNQITGDTIHLISNTETDRLDSLKIRNNSLMVQKDSAGFSQLKGKNMLGLFKENNLRSLDVVGNSEVIFYIRDEQEKLIGISKMESSKNILIHFENKAIETVDFIVKPSGHTYPPPDFPEDEKRFKEFVWRADEQPLTKDDIFEQDKELSTENKS